MPVEDLVVDHDDVGPAVDVVAVAVDHRRGASGGPDAGLAGPAGLHDVGHDDQQRVGVGGLRGQQCLGGLAQARLVGEQEGPVALGGGLDHLRLVLHQLAAGRGDQRPGLGQRHARRRAAVLEGAEEGTQQLPAGEPAGPGVLGGGAGEVGDEEGVGEATGDHALRDDPLLDDGGVRVVLVHLGLVGHLEAGALLHLTTQVLRGVADLGVLGQQVQERGVAGGGLGQDRRDAVEALELLGALGLRGLRVGLDPGPLLADQQGHDLELRARTRRHGTALGGTLHLAHRARQDGDDPLVVEVAHPSLGALTVATTLGPSSHSLLLRAGAPSVGRTAIGPGRASRRVPGTAAQAGARTDEGDSLPVVGPVGPALGAGRSGRAVGVPGAAAPGPRGANETTVSHRPAPGGIPCGPGAPEAVSGLGEGEASGGLFTRPGGLARGVRGAPSRRSRSRITTSGWCFHPQG